MSPSDPARSSLPPLVLTLLFESGVQAYFDTLRKEHYPPGQNRIQAHLTLFHALPGSEEAGILHVLRGLSEGLAMQLEVTSLMKLGGGVAFRIQSAALRSIHTRLQQRWQPWLTAQDRQGFRPHVVIQNKVDPSIAAALYAKLAPAFQPFACTAAGLILWRYMGGPWERLETIPFNGTNSAAR